MFKSSLALLLILLLCNPLQAAVHRWVDEQGNVHFSDSPPKNQNSEKVRIDATPSSSGSHYKERLNRQKDYLEERRESREEAKQLKAEQKAEKEKNQQRCASDKLELELSNRRLVRANPDGSRHYLDDKEREAHFDKLRERIKTNCK